MRTSEKSVLSGLAAGCVLTGSAMGGLMPVAESGPSPSGSGIPAVAPNAEASLALRMFGGGDIAFINASGDVNVPRGTEAFTDIGANVNGAGLVMAQWDEYIAESYNTIQIVWKTSNGEDLLPAGSMVGGAEAEFLGWLVGASLPIGFGGWVDALSVDILNATVSISSDGGSSFDAFNVTDTLSDPWDGTDTNSALPIVGEGVNFILAQYQFTFIPAPTAAGVMLLGVGLGVRRRR